MAHINAPPPPPSTLRYRTAQGMAPALVRQEAAETLARHTGFRPDACRWAVDGLAAALEWGAGSRPEQ